jgi:ATP-dependent DNA ligase
VSVAFRELERRVKRSVTFEPCLPRTAKEPPTAPGWVHEIEHGGFRIVAQKQGDRVRLVARNGYDFTERYPLIVDAVRSLPGTSCVIDGEAIVVDRDGLSVFDLSAVSAARSRRDPLRQGMKVSSPSASALPIGWDAATSG